MSEFFNPYAHWHMMMIMQYNMWNNQIWFQRFPQNSQFYQANPYSQVQIKQPNTVSQVKLVEVAKQPTQIKGERCGQKQKNQGIQRQFVRNSFKTSGLAPKNNNSKNTETNIVNQAFSFLFYRKKSLNFVQKLCGGNEQKVQVFYKYMSTIKKLKQKYANKQYFKNLVNLPEKSRLFEIISRSRKRAEILNVQQLRSIIRRLVLFFLRSHIFPIIMNNSKFAKKTRFYHMQKITQLKKIIYEV